MIVQLSTAINKFKIFSIALALAGTCSYGALAQDTHTQSNAQNSATTGQQSDASALLRLVRQATEQFKDVAEAERQKYFLGFGCVTGPDKGAMGLHYINQDLLGKGEVDVMHPQIVIYEPQADGHLKLIGADYLVFADKWDAAPNHKDANGNVIAPKLMGQLFHYFESPNRFALPAFYTLHVWAWKENPDGAFVNWHPNVDCSAFIEPQTVK